MTLWQSNLGFFWIRIMSLWSFKQNEYQSQIFFLFSFIYLWHLIFQRTFLITIIKQLSSIHNAINYIVINFARAEVSLLTYSYFYISVFIYYKVLKLPHAKAHWTIEVTHSTLTFGRLPTYKENKKTSPKLTFRTSSNNSDQDKKDFLL